MTYTLVEKSDRYELENPDGDVIETYDDRPSHPTETANAIEEDFSNNPTDMFVFLLREQWDFRVDKPFESE